MNPTHAMIKTHIRCRNDAYGRGAGRVLENKQEFVWQTRQRRTLQTGGIIWVKTWENEVT